MLPLSATAAEQQPHAFCYGGRAAATKRLPQGSAFPCYSMCALLLGYYSAAISGSRPQKRLHGLAQFPHGGRSAATPRHASAWQDQEIRVSGTCYHASAPATKDTHALGSMASTRPPQLEGELSSKEGDIMCRKYCSCCEQ